MLDYLAECTQIRDLKVELYNNVIDASVGSISDVDGACRADHVRPTGGIFQIRNDLVRNHLISVNNCMYWLEMKKAADETA